jgi:hypothetical protein
MAQRFIACDREQSFLMPPDEAYRARGVGRTGRRFSPGATPKPYTPPAVPEGSINTTDLDSRLVKGMRGWLQGYNAQAATNEQQIASRPR